MNDPTTTEISIPGANCPWCLNETLAVLRAEPGVTAVATSITGQCLRVEHTGVGTDHLLDVVRRHLRADDSSSAEHVMVEVELALADHHSRHHRTRTHRGGGRD